MIAEAKERIKNPTRHVHESPKMRKGVGVSPPPVASSIGVTAKEAAEGFVRLADEFSRSWETGTSSFGHSTHTLESRIFRS